MASNIELGHAGTNKGLDERSIVSVPKLETKGGVAAEATSTSASPLNAHTKSEGYAKGAIAKSAEGEAAPGTEEEEEEETTSTSVVRPDSFHDATIYFCLVSKSSTTQTKVSAWEVYSHEDDV